MWPLMIRTFFECIDAEAKRTLPPHEWTPAHRDAWKRFLDSAFQMAAEQYNQPRDAVAELIAKPVQGALIKKQGKVPAQPDSSRAISTASSNKASSDSNLMSDDDDFKVPV